MPYTGIVLTIVALHAAAFLILLGHWLVAVGLFPTATKACATRYDRTPVRAIFLGVFTYGPLLLILLNSASIPIPALRVAAIGIGLAAILVALLGSAGLALRIGRNLCGTKATPWQQGLRGGIMLALVFITPALGSLFLLHVGLASGFGAFLLSRPWRSTELATLPTQAPAPVLS